MAPKGRGRGGRRGRGRGKGRDSGPNYPSRLLKEIGLPLDLNDRKRRHSRKSGKPEDQPESVANDVYEYQEGVPQEESGKNRRFDTVDKLEYELPSDFEDEEIDEGAASGEENAGRLDDNSLEDDEDGREEGEEDDDDDEEEEDEGDREELHDRMLMEVTGRANRHAKKVKEDSSYMDNSNEEVPITVEDLLAPLQEKPGFNALKKRVRSLQKSAAPVSVPLPKNIQERIDRQAGYEKTVEDITKWQPIVKKNREASTLKFIDKASVSLSSTTSMVAEFEPSTAFEKEVAALLNENGVADPSQIEAKESLELNKLSVDEVRDRQERLAKMRSLLFRHEERAKRLKKIKSKTFHRLARKSQKTKADMLADDPDIQLEETMKQELNRARERMTLKHKNTSRWAKRILKRGLQQHNEGTREAITEQLREHALLTRKIHSAKSESSSSDEDEEDDSDKDDEPGLVLDKPGLKELAKAKVATLKALEEGTNDTELPSTGIFALPFMVRAIEKRRKEAEDEARAVLEELESAGGDDADPSQETAPLKGKQSFGGQANKAAMKAIDEEDDMVERGSDSENSEDESPLTGAKMLALMETKKNVTADPAPVKAVDIEDVDLEGMVSSAMEHTTKADEPITIARNKSEKKKKKKKNKNKELSTRREDGMVTKHSVISANPTLFGTDKGARPQTNGQSVGDKSVKVTIAGRPKDTSQKPVTEQENEEGSVEEQDEDPDYDGDKVMVPRSQEDLIREAFAGDDVEAEFKEAKATAVDEECPLPELERMDLPGWGQWTDIQKKRGPPQWMIKQQEEAKRKKEEAEKRRLDAKLKHVIISEKTDKKAAKFQSPMLPFPYTSKEVFEKTMRMPLGRDYNPTKAFQDLTRPPIIKRAGVIISPIEFQDVKDTKRKRRHEDNTPQGPRDSKKDRRTKV